MVKVKEFFEDMVWDNDDEDWYHDPDGMRLDEKINKFIEECDIRVIAIKYWVKEHKNGEDESQALLVYDTRDRKPFENKGDE